MVDEILHVFLDTSFLLDHTPWNIADRQLRYLAERGRVQVHVPWIVEYELRTRLGNIASRNLADVRMLCTWFPRHLGEPLQEKLSITRELLKRNIADIDRCIIEWLEIMKAKREKPTELDSVGAFSRYFSGEPPFKSMKQRDDLPDAFIFEAIRRFSVQQSRPIHAIIRDNNLARHLSTLPHLTVHYTLQSFLASPKLSPHTTQASLLVAFNDCLDSKLEKINRKITEQTLDRIIRGSLGSTLDDEHIISEPGIVSDLHFNEGDSRAIGKNALEIGFDCNVIGSKSVAIIESWMTDPIFDGDYVSSDYEISHIEDDDDHVLLNNNVDLSIKGVATFEFEEVGDNLLGAVSGIDIEIEDLEQIDA